MQTHTYIQMCNCSTHEYLLNIDEATNCTTEIGTHSYAFIYVFACMCVYNV